MSESNPLQVFFNPGVGASGTLMITMPDVGAIGATFSMEIIEPSSGERWSGSGIFVEGSGGAMASVGLDTLDPVGSQGAIDPESLTFPIEVVAGMQGPYGQEFLQFEVRDVGAGSYDVVPMTGSDTTPDQGPIYDVGGYGYTSDLYLVTGEGTTESPIDFYSIYPSGAGNDGEYDTPDDIYEVGAKITNVTGEPFASFLSLPSSGPDSPMPVGMLNENGSVTMYEPTDEEDTGGDGDWTDTTFVVVTGVVDTDGIAMNIPIETKDGMFRVSYTEDGTTYSMTLTDAMGENLTVVDANIPLENAFVMNPDGVVGTANGGQPRSKI